MKRKNFLTIVCVLVMSAVNNIFAMDRYYSRENVQKRREQRQNARTEKANIEKEACLELNLEKMKIVDKEELTRINRSVRMSHQEERALFAQLSMNEQCIIKSAQKKGVFDLDSKITICNGDSENFKILAKWHNKNIDAQILDIHSGLSLRGVLKGHKPINIYSRR